MREAQRCLLARADRDVLKCVADDARYKAFLRNIKLLGI